MTTTTHTCAACGAAFEARGGWNNYNKILRCDACASARAVLIADLIAAHDLRPDATIYVASSVYGLLDATDLPFEVLRRADAKMPAGARLQVISAQEERTARVAELKGKIAAEYAARVATLKGYKGQSKEDLLAEYGRHHRIHGLTTRDTLTDIKYALLDAERGTTTLARWEKELRSLETAQA